LSWDGIHERFGPTGVQGFELFWEESGNRFAPYTDDTQMAEQVFLALGETRRAGLDLDQAMQFLSLRFVEWSKNPQGGHRAPGNACLAGCRALASGTSWREAGGEKAGGCGSVMRAYPFGLFFYDDVARAEKWSVAHSKLTHRDPIALAACAAMAVGMAHAVQGVPMATSLASMLTVAGTYSPPTKEMMRQAYLEAKQGVEPVITLDRLRGWAAHEAIAATVYILARHPMSIQEALLEAVNTPGDSDSLGTLVGALLGARLGFEALPEEWCAEIERATELREMAQRELLRP